MLLNAHSTLLMGRMGRYQSNIMTYVRPSNNKLIDRAIRYVQYLLRQRGIEIAYEEVCQALFRCREGLGQNEAIVLKTLAALL